jgi:hypothetical protein
MQRRLDPAAYEMHLSFDQIYQTVTQQIGCIEGVGSLTIYDTATRIGEFLGFHPEEVYLHCGVKAGARALGLELRGRETVSVTELPAEFRRLSAGEIEDCLCIYKREIAMCKG